jgi:hypothetical protein
MIVEWVCELAHHGPICPTFAYPGRDFPTAQVLDASKITTWVCGRAFRPRQQRSTGVGLVVTSCGRPGRARREPMTTILGTRSSSKRPTLGPRPRFPPQFHLPRHTDPPHRAAATPRTNRDRSPTAIRRSTARGGAARLADGARPGPRQIGSASPTGPAGTPAGPPPRRPGCGLAPARCVTVRRPGACRWRRIRVGTRRPCRIGDRIPVGSAKQRSARPAGRSVARSASPPEWPRPPGCPMLVGRSA